MLTGKCIATGKITTGVQAMIPIDALVDISCVEKIL
jgi:hypothetical protein